ncbi:MAG: hypothetical protein M1833_003869 [Piccolia ochrophora]|nr:MAG: hypothetical protein M1833_003869 [Piccolia ochrophora]
MRGSTLPKALLFDIGGVCVKSPFQAILDYELAHGIPPGWVNFAISQTAPNGAWQRLERGELDMDATFFDHFHQDLHSKELWKAFNSPQSEGVNTSKHARPCNIHHLPSIDSTWLFWEMMRVSRTPDPLMYSALRRLKTSGKFVIGALSNTVIFPSDHPYSGDIRNDLRSMFDIFVSSAHVGLRKPDPKIYEHTIREVNRVARSSYRQIGSQESLDTNIKAEDIVFLDDIGQNLKAAKQIGMRTIKVNLGKSKEAVQELERMTGMALLDSGDVKARI